MKANGSSQGKKYRNSELTLWIRENFLNFKALNQTEDLVREIS